MKNRKKIFLLAGSGLMAIGFIIAGAMAWDIFYGFSKKIHMLEVPGFSSLKLDSPGLYVGLYQHRGSGPMPIEQLSLLDVKLLTKETYQEIPVLMNNSGQSFTRLGIRALPLFNFMIETPGEFTFSAVYPGMSSGPSVQILLISQAAQNIRQVLLVGGFFFLLFLSLGVWVLVMARSIPASEEGAKKR